uniref:Uncharacterized protein n=1 Tax=Acrobeloides nanus TaxID=290746 RepID=A0A914CGC6_9BILA
MNLDALEEHWKEQKQRQPDEFKIAGRLYSPSRKNSEEIDNPVDIDQIKFSCLENPHQEKKQNENFWHTLPPDK